VLHLADYQDFAGAPGPRSAGVGHWRTECLLNALLGFHVEQFVYLSTMLVHAPCRLGELIHEDWPLRRSNLQADWAARSEQRVRTQHADMPIVLLRAASVYDDRTNSSSLAHQIQRIYERRLSGHIYPGDPELGRSFVHVADLVEALRCCIERRSRLPDEVALLIGEPGAVSYDALQRSIGRLLHHEVWETFQIPRSIARTGAWLERNVLRRNGRSMMPQLLVGADDHYALNITRAELQLGWRPAHTLLAMLPDMVESLCANPSRWYEVNHLTAPRHANARLTSERRLPAATRA
jgi:nucleoside-diphosphate-sugar epimerase